MASPDLLRLTACSDPALVGGKTATLGALARAGFPVPPGICVTTAVFRQACRSIGGRGKAPPPIGALQLPRQIRDTLLTELEELAGTAAPAGSATHSLWAVRSSATTEDSQAASFGGLYRSALGVPTEEVPAAVLRCWLSLWSEAAEAYTTRVRGPRPAMAVLIQPLLAARAAGVAFSRHPMTHDPTRLVVNAVLGLAEPLVSGQSPGDQYLVAREGDGEESLTILERTVVSKTFRREVPTAAAWPVPSAAESSPVYVTDAPVAAECRDHPALTDAQLLALARLLCDVEAALGHPVDIEWAWTDRLWLLQARPLTGQLSDAASLWSRTNFMETLPELPSPAALAFLHRFMDHNILRHYRSLGCDIPPSLSAVRVVRGRPYLNITLFQSVTAQLGGDPRLVVEQVGGEPHETITTPRLPFWRRLRAVVKLQARIALAGLRAPRWFAELDRLVTTLVSEAEGAPERELVARLEESHRRLEAEDLTFALVGGVSEALQVLRLLLAPRMPQWGAALSRATRALGTIVSARQIVTLQQLAALAQQEPRSRAFFLQEPWEPDRYREALRGTEVLAHFEAFLQEYGHRAIGESDLMSPRYAERPAYLLDTVRRHLSAPASTPARDPGCEQRERQAALAGIRRAFGWRLHEWVWFRLWHSLLCRYQTLRETNRHAQMKYVAAARRLLLSLGQRAEQRGLLDDPEDIFFLVPEELRELAHAGPAAPERAVWRQRAAVRREQRRRDEAVSMPHTLRGLEMSERVDERQETEVLRGLPICAGRVHGPVRRVLDAQALSQVEHGDVVVAPVLDPGMAPVFALAGGIVVEMGGLLSHGAIIAREYGIPTLANVKGATRLLQDGERVTLDATRGELRREIAAP